MTTPDQELLKREGTIPFLIKSLSNPPSLNVSEHVLGPEICLESFRCSNQDNQLSLKILLGFGQLLSSLKGRTVEDVSWITDHSASAGGDHIGCYCVKLRP